MEKFSKKQYYCPNIHMIRVLYSVCTDGKNRRTNFNVNPNWVENRIKEEKKRGEIGNVL